MRSELRLASVLTFLFAAAIGCDERDGDVGASLGLDRDGFVALEEDEVLLLEPGTQGGHHVDLSIRVEGIHAAGALLELEGVDADSGEALFVSVVRQLGPAEVEPYDNHWIRFDERLVWIDADPTSGEGRRVHLMATVTDSSGETNARGDVVVRIGYPTLTLGFDSGGLQFAPSTDGDEIEIVAGVQGLHHLEVSLLANHVEVDGAILSVNGIDADSGEVLTVAALRVLSPNRVTQEGTSWVRFGELMVLLVLDPLDAVGRRIRIEATVTDPLSGRVAADTATLDLVDDTPGL